jgi:hypothetical protein
MSVSVAAECTGAGGKALIAAAVRRADLTGIHNWVIVRLIGRHSMH